jgi:serpin B
MLALTMTANGADSNTLAEMESVIGRGLALESLNGLLRDYVAALPSTDVSSINIANSIWYDDNRVNVHDTFLQNNRDLFNAEIIGENFDNVGHVIRRVNGWVHDKTEGMIDSILHDICCCAVMYLINAIAFDAEWQTPYTLERISKRDFTAFDGTVQNTDFMFSNEYSYIETENSTGFIKPYKNGHYSFAALLPNSDTDITEFISGLTEHTLQNALNNVSDEKVSTGMPKFSFEYEITMNQMLADMGMPTAFDGNAADFSNLGSSDDGNIFISKVLHKTFIQVDELGTRAGAVTSVEVNVTSGAPSTTKEVILNRPFVFAIVDNVTNLPIFVGTLMEM